MSNTQQKWTEVYSLTTHLFYFMDVPDICAIRRCCVDFNEHVKEYDLWEQLVYRDFIAAPPSTSESSTLKRTAAAAGLLPQRALAHLKERALELANVVMRVQEAASAAMKNSSSLSSAGPGAAVERLILSESPLAISQLTQSSGAGIFFCLGRAAYAAAHCAAFVPAHYARILLTASNSAPPQSSSSRLSRSRIHQLQQVAAWQVLPQSQDNNRYDPEKGSATIKLTLLPQEFNDTIYRAGATQCNGQRCVAAMLRYEKNQMMTARQEEQQQRGRTTAASSSSDDDRSSQTVRFFNDISAAQEDSAHRSMTSWDRFVALALGCEQQQQDQQQVKKAEKSGDEETESSSSDEDGTSMSAARDLRRRVRSDRKEHAARTAHTAALQHSSCSIRTIIADTVYLSLVCVAEHADRFLRDLRCASVVSDSAGLRLCARLGIMSSKTDLPTEIANELAVLYPEAPMNDVTELTVSLDGGGIGGGDDERSSGFAFAVGTTDGMPGTTSGSGRDRKTDFVGASAVQDLFSTLKTALLLRRSIRFEFIVVLLAHYRHPWSSLLGWLAQPVVSAVSAVATSEMIYSVFVRSVSVFLKVWAVIAFFTPASILSLLDTLYMLPLKMLFSTYQFGGIASSLSVPSSLVSENSFAFAALAASSLVTIIGFRLAAKSADLRADFFSRTSGSPAASFLVCVPPARRVIVATMPSLFVTFVWHHYFFGWSRSKLYNSDLFAFAPPLSRLTADLLPQLFSNISVALANRSSSRVFINCTQLPLHQFVVSANWRQLSWWSSSEGANDDDIAGTEGSASRFLFLLFSFTYAWSILLGFVVRYGEAVLRRIKTEQVLSLAASSSSSSSSPSSSAAAAREALLTRSIGLVCAKHAAASDTSSDLSGNNTCMRCFLVAAMDYSVKTFVEGRRRRTSRDDDDKIKNRSNPAAFLDAVKMRAALAEKVALVTLLHVCVIGCGLADLVTRGATMTELLVYLILNHLVTVI